MLPKDFHEDVKSVCIKESRNSDDVFLSIAIPTYKRNEFLEECIDSAINQDLNGVDFNYEIIVTNNDPEADMSYFIEKYKDVDNISFYINEKDILTVGNMNRGAMLAKGKFVAYLHDDDLLKPNYLKEMGKFFARREIKGAICYIPERDVLWLAQRDDDTNLSTWRLTKKFIKKYFSKTVDAFRKVFRLICFKDLYVYELTQEISMHAFFNIYKAPSCGTALDKEKLFEAGGWTSEGGMSFDWYSCLRFNGLFKIYKLQKSLGIYRFANNISLKRSTRIDCGIQDTSLLYKKYKSEKLNKWLEKNRKTMTYMRINGINKPDEQDEVYNALKDTLKIERYKPSLWESRLYYFKKFCYLKTHTLE